MPRSRQLAAIMFTDIEGYTTLMQQNEEKAIQAREKHRRIFNSITAKHHGRILQYYGDGTLSIFNSAIEAVSCAIEMQLGFQSTPAIPVRIGIHTGDIIFSEEEIIGDGVNVAARIESMSIAGAILISGKLNDELKNQGQFSTRSLGQFVLKNVKIPIEVFAIANQGIKIPARSEMKGTPKNKFIAVLPFINVSADKDNEYFCDGMTEEIINALTKIPDLKVTSRSSSFFFKNKNIPIPQIGKELNVSTIMEGSIRLAGNKMAHHSTAYRCQRRFSFLVRNI